MYLVVVVVVVVVVLQYLGNHMSEKVKRRCTELLFNWSQVLAHEPKIKEAYQMLRRQGIIKQDPVQVESLVIAHCLTYSYDS